MDRRCSAYSPRSASPLAGGNVIDAIARAANPRLVRYRVAGEWTSFWALLRRLVGFAAVLGVAGTLLSLDRGWSILAAVYGAEYAREAPMLVQLSLAATVGFAA